MKLWLWTDKTWLPPFMHDVHRMHKKYSFIIPTTSIKWQNAVFSHDPATELYHSMRPTVCKDWWGVTLQTGSNTDWPYQPLAEQQMQIVYGTLAPGLKWALQEWESVDASSWCVEALPPGVRDCSVLLKGPDLWCHLPTPSLLCTENKMLPGNLQIQHIILGVYRYFRKS